MALVGGSLHCSYFSFISNWRKNRKTEYYNYSSSFWLICVFIATYYSFARICCYNTRRASIFGIFQDFTNVCATTYSVGGVYNLFNSKKLYIKKVVDASTDFSNMDPKVFISYNHSDSEVALKILDALEKASIEVIIDQEDMMAGADIKNFIEKSIGESTVTVSLVSNRSLKSAWVALETIDTFFLERYMKNKKFIACYLDDDFFQPDYTLKAVTDIDEQLKTNQKMIPEYQQKMIDTRDLNIQNTRLLALRNNLDGIIGRLRDSLCLDVREEPFNQSMKKLIQAIEDDS